MTYNSYSVFGLHVHAQLALPELSPSGGFGSPDVRIRCGGIDLAEGASGYSLTGSGTLLTVPKVGRYLIIDGREIVVDAAPEASDRNVRLYLLGSAFGAILHQRGMMPLHANSIEIGNRAVAFSGHSGAGKSTMAAWFCDRGHRILADDVCAIAFDSAGHPIAYPGLPRLRLWRDALEVSGRSTSDFSRSFDDQDKYEVPTHQQLPGGAMKLGAIYMLKKADETGGEAVIRRLNGVEAVDALVANTYRGAYLKMIGGTGPHLMQCLKLAQNVPVFEATRLWGFDCFDQQASRLAAHALTCGPTSPGLTLRQAPNGNR